MFVYVVAFAGRPELIKIGRATKVRERMYGLVRAHGRVERLTYFKVGAQAKTLEFDLHRDFSEYSTPLAEKSSGYTEFFKREITEEVEGLLVGVAEEVFRVSGDEWHAQQRERLKPVVKTPEEAAAWELRRLQTLVRDLTGELRSKEIELQLKGFELEHEKRVVGMLKERMAFQDALLKDQRKTAQGMLNVIENLMKQWE